MPNVINFKFVLNSSLYPAMPIFSGALGVRSVTKWRGAAAEFTYNPYLRNGWVVIDTGVKGGSGTPIIEFSTWQAHTSRSNIILPNTISYKFFTANREWCSGYLTRTSVVANENWVLGGERLPTVLNTYNAWRSQNGASNLFLHIPTLSSIFIYQNLLGSDVTFNAIKANSRRMLFAAGSTFSKLQLLAKNTRLLLKFTKKLQSYRRDLLRFIVADKLFLTDFYTHYTSATFFKFTSLLVTAFKRKVLLSVRAGPALLNTTGESAKSLFGRTVLDLSAIFFRLNTIILFYLKYKHKPIYQKIFDKLLRAALRPIILTVFFSMVTFNQSLTLIEALVTFLTSRVQYILFSSKLSLLNLSKLVVFFLTKYLAAALELPNFKQTSLGSLSVVGVARKLKKLHVSALFGRPSINGALTALSLSSLETKKSFFSNYLKVRTRFLKHFSCYSKRKRRKKYSFSIKRKRKKNTNGLRVKCYFRAWSHLKSYFKLFIVRKQFFFISFWTFNFFNLSLVENCGNPKRIFFRTVRLIHFFKKFFKFFKFYAFYFHLLRLLTSSALRSRKDYKHLLNNLKVFLWILHVKFWRLLRAFYSLAKKFFLIRWKKLTLRAAKSTFVVNASNYFYNSRSIFIFKSRKLNSLLPVRELKSLRREAVLNVLIKSYGVFIKTFNGHSSLRVDSNFTRNYLYFLLTLRRKAFFTLQLKLKAKTSNILELSASTTRPDASFNEFLRSSKSFVNCFAFVESTKSGSLRSSLRYELRGFTILLNRVHFLLERLSPAVKTFYSSVIVRTFAELTRIFALGSKKGLKKIDLILRSSLLDLLKTLISLVKHQRSFARVLLRLVWGVVLLFSLLNKKTQRAAWKLRVTKRYRKNLAYSQLRVTKYNFNNIFIDRKPFTNPQPLQFKNFLLGSRHTLRVGKLTPNLPLKSQHNLDLSKTLLDIFGGTGNFPLNLNQLFGLSSTASLGSHFFQKIGGYRKLEYFNWNLLSSKSLSYSGAPLFLKNSNTSKSLTAAHEYSSPCLFTAGDSSKLVFNYRGAFFAQNTGFTFLGSTLAIFNVLTSETLPLTLRTGLFSAITASTRFVASNAFFFKTNTFFRIKFLNKSLVTLLSQLHLASYNSFCASDVFVDNTYNALPSVSLKPNVFGYRHNFFAYFLKERILLQGNVLPQISYKNAELFAFRVFPAFSTVAETNLQIFNNTPQSNLFFRSTSAAYHLNSYMKWVSRLFKFKNRQLNPLTSKIKKLRARFFLNRRRQNSLRALRQGRRVRVARRKLRKLNRVLRRFTRPDMLPRLKVTAQQLFLQKKANRFTKKFSRTIVAPFNQPLVFYGRVARLARRSCKKAKNLRPLSALTSIFAGTLINDGVSIVSAVLAFGINSAPAKARVLRNTLRRVFVAKFQTFNKCSNVTPSYISKKRYILNFLSTFALLLLRKRGTRSAKLFYAKSSFFRKLRSVPKLLLEVKARKLGISLPKRVKKVFFRKRSRFFKWGKRRPRMWLPKHRRPKRKTWIAQNNFLAGADGKTKTRPGKTPAQIPSIFNRKNMKSMGLSNDFRGVKFRFLKLKSLFQVKRKVRFSLKALGRRFYKTFRAWQRKKQKQKRFIRLFRRSKLTRLVKKSRKFYLKKLLRMRLRFAFKRASFRAFKKLLIIKQNFGLLKFTGIPLLHKFRTKLVKKMPYNVLHTLIIRQFLVRVYSAYLLKKTAFRVNLFKALRFQFVFKFIDFFFKKIFMFFTGFSLFTKLAFLTTTSFLFFANVFAATTSRTFFQKNVEMFAQNDTLVLKGLAVFNKNAQNAFTKPKTIPLQKSVTFFVLTGTLSFFNRLLTQDPQLAIIASFVTAPALVVWSRVARSVNSQLNINRTLIVSRLSAYLKPRHISRQFRSSRLTEKRITLAKKTNKLRQMFKDFTAPFLRRQVSRLGLLSFSALQKLQKAKAFNQVKIGYPLFKILKSSFCKKTTFKRAVGRAQTRLNLLRNSFSIVKRPQIRGRLWALSNKTRESLDIRAFRQLKLTKRLAYIRRKKNLLKRGLRIPPLKLSKLKPILMKKDVDPFLFVEKTKKTTQSAIDLAPNFWKKRLIMNRIPKILGLYDLDASGVKAHWYSSYANVTSQNRVARGRIISRNSLLVKRVARLPFIQKKKFLRIRAAPLKPLKSRNYRRGSKSLVGLNRNRYSKPSSRSKQTNRQKRSRGSKYTVN